MPDWADPEELGVDQVTPAAVVVLCERPVVPLSAWLARVVVATAASGRAVQLVTPTTSRLTMPLVSLLQDADSTWVAHDPNRTEYYDGMSGVPMAWQGDAFQYLYPVDGEPRVAAGYANPPPPTGRHLRLRFEVRHAATAWTSIGGAVDVVCRALTGQPPAGWGFSEPVSRAWRAADLTAAARDTAPHGWLIMVGAGDRPAVGAVEVTRVADGVQETAELLLGYPEPVAPPVAELAGLADALAREHRLTFLYAETRLARPDLTRPAHAEGVPLPVGLAIGPGPPDLAGTALDEDIPPPVRIGSEGSTLWYRLSDGDSIAGWARLGALVEAIRTTEERLDFSNADGLQ
jgi:Family of unknown function (DUF6177)